MYPEVLELLIFVKVAVVVGIGALATTAVKNIIEVIRGRD